MMVDISRKCVEVEIQGTEFSTSKVQIKLNITKIYYSIIRVYDKLTNILQNTSLAKVDTYLNKRH